MKIIIRCRFVKLFKATWLVDSLFPVTFNDTEQTLLLDDEIDLN